MSLFRTKSVASLQAQAAAPTGLKRELTVSNLISLGIGSVIGAGVFVLSGQTAAQYSGPAIALAYVISGIASLLAGLCYAEFAAMIPIASERGVRGLYGRSPAVSASKISATAIIRAGMLISSRRSPRG